MPVPSAKPIGAHARLYNYPARSRAVTLADVPRYGIKTAFCSSSLAAYLRDALAQAGGFPRGTIFGEDLLAATSILWSGWTVHYAAMARVHQSHNYGLVEEFRRYFDIGVWTRILGYIDDELEPGGQINRDHGMFGGIDDLIRLFRDDQVDRVFIALPWNRARHLRQVTQPVATTPVTIHLAPDLAGF